MSTTPQTELDELRNETDDLMFELWEQTLSALANERESYS